MLFINSIPIPKHTLSKPQNMCKHILSDMLSGKNESQTSKKMTFQCMKE